ncbi:MAG: YkgJ family cysteine cluster protein [Phycisphaerales bacterium]|nr:YkgJ family cysteine cluster protein [Phycisphaerales bacterium]
MTPRPPKDARTVRIAIVGPSPCEQCNAACCKQSAWPYAVLLQDEDERRRFRPWSTTTLLADADGETKSVQVIGYREGRCPFLGEDDRCTVYEDRPLSCRQFECTRRFGQDETFFDRNPAVRTLLVGLA